MGRDLAVDMRTMEQREYAFTFCENREQFSLDIMERIKKSSWWNGVMRENKKFGLEEFLKVLSKQKTAFQGAK